MTQPSRLRTLIRGGLAGGIATWLMDLVTTASGSSKPGPTLPVRRPCGLSTVVNLVDLMERRPGITMDERSRSAAANLIHYGLGVIPGALYAASRDRVPGRRTTIPSRRTSGIGGPPRLGVATDVGIDVTGG